MKRRRISPTTITTGIASDAPWHTNTARRRGCGYFIWSACTPRSITRPTATSSSPNVCGAGKSGSRPSYGFARNTGDVQVAHRPARRAGTFSRGFGFFFMMASERRESRSRFHRNLYGDTPSSVVRAKIISNFVTADVRKDCGGHTGSVFRTPFKKMWQFSIAKGNGNSTHSCLDHGRGAFCVPVTPYLSSVGYRIVYFAMGSPHNLSLR